MKIDLRDVTVRWVNVDSDTEKNVMMENLCERVGFKNASRFSAVTGIEPHEGVNPGEEHYRNCAESHFKIYEETDTFPLLILEDDVEIEESVFTYNLDNVPDDADAIYFGTSHGDGNYSAQDVGGGWMRVQRVFATHAIMYLNPDICNAVTQVGKKWIYEHNRPFDVGFAYEVQPQFKVYAPHTPFFYQADSKNTKNKWEGLTRTPLRMKKRFTIGTMS